MIKNIFMYNNNKLGPRVTSSSSYKDISRGRTSHLPGIKCLTGSNYLHCCIVRILCRSEDHQGVVCQRLPLLDRKQESLEGAMVVGCENETQEKVPDRRVKLKEQDDEWRVGLDSPDGNVISRDSQI